MLNPVHDDDLGRVVDAVDDPVVASSRREKVGEFADQRFIEPVRVFTDGAMQRGHRCVADLRRETVQVTESLRSGAELVWVPRRRTHADGKGSDLP